MLSFPPKKQHAQLSMASEHQMPASKQQPASSKVSAWGQDTPNPLWAFQLQLQCRGDHAAALPFGVPSVTKASYEPRISSQSPAIPTDVMHALLPPH